MFCRRQVGLAVLGLAILGPGANEARAQGTCGDLWYQRNSIYKAAGYCFKTPRAIRTFGNAGCRYDDEYELPLSGQQRRIIANITRAERDLGCR